MVQRQICNWLVVLLTRNVLHMSRASTDSVLIRVIVVQTPTVKLSIIILYAIAVLDSLETLRLVVSKVNFLC